MREVTSDAANQVVPHQREAQKFDYDSLPPSVSKFLRGQASRIWLYSTKSIIQIGKDLLCAKHYLSHGQFLRWVESEVGLPARTAQAYMRVANWASSKNATVALLPPSALYALASNGIPTEFVDGVLSRVESGERIQIASLRAQIKALRENTSRGIGGSADGEMDGRAGDCSYDTLDTPPAPAALISNAIRILARALPAHDFAQVREIITSKPVLDDPNLARLLERAFDSCEDIATQQGGFIEIVGPSIVVLRARVQGGANEDAICRGNT